MKLLMLCVALFLGYVSANVSCMKDNIQVEVVTAIKELRVSRNDYVRLPCDYSISIDEDLPVTITWSTGDGLRQSDPVFQCKGFTKAKSCRSFEYLDDDYIGRIDFDGLPSLNFNVGSDGSKNYWCNVTLEDAINVELGMDMKGVGLAIDGEMPKLNFVKVGKDVEADVGYHVKLDCICTDSGHCDDVGWYKGSIQEELQPVITRTSGGDPHQPISTTAYGEWTDRVELNDNALTIRNLSQSDSGRYWCEPRSASYKGLGPMAFDSESVTLNVIAFTCSTYDGNYADPKDCTKYYRCINESDLHMTCHPKYVFDDILKICDWPK